MKITIDDLISKYCKLYEDHIEYKKNLKKEESNLEENRECLEYYIQRIKDNKSAQMNKKYLSTDVRALINRKNVLEEKKICLAENPLDLKKCEEDIEKCKFDLIKIKDHIRNCENSVIKDQPYLKRYKDDLKKCEEAIEKNRANLKEAENHMEEINSEVIGRFQIGDVVTDPFILFRNKSDNEKIIREKLKFLIYISTGDRTGILDEVISFDQYIIADVSECFLDDGGILIYLARNNCEKVFDIVLNKIKDYKEILEKQLYGNRSGEFTILTFDKFNILKKLKNILNEEELDKLILAQINSIDKYQGNEESGFTIYYKSLEYKKYSNSGFDEIHRFLPYKNEKQYLKLSDTDSSNEKLQLLLIYIAQNIPESLNHLLKFILETSEFTDDQIYDLLLKKNKNSDEADTILSILIDNDSLSELEKVKILEDLLEILNDARGLMYGTMLFNSLFLIKDDNGNVVSTIARKFILQKKIEKLKLIKKLIDRTMDAADDFFFNLLLTQDKHCNVTATVAIDLSLNGEIKTLRELKDILTDKQFDKLLEQKEAQNNCFPLAAAAKRGNLKIFYDTFGEIEFKKLFLAKSGSGHSALTYVASRKGFYLHHPLKDICDLRSDTGQKLFTNEEIYDSLVKRNKNNEITDTAFTLLINFCNGKLPNHCIDKIQKSFCDDTLFYDLILEKLNNGHSLLTFLSSRKYLEPMFYLLKLICDLKNGDDKPFLTEEQIHELLIRKDKYGDVIYTVLSYITDTETLKNLKNILGGYGDEFFKKYCVTSCYEIMEEFDKFTIDDTQHLDEQLLLGDESIEQ